VYYYPILFNTSLGLSRLGRVASLKDEDVSKLKCFMETEDWTLEELSQMDIQPLTEFLTRIEITHEQITPLARAIKSNFR
jgi:hypothetical protein